MLTFDKVVNTIGADNTMKYPKYTAHIMGIGFVLVCILWAMVITA